MFISKNNYECLRIDGKSSTNRQFWWMSKHLLAINHEWYIYIYIYIYTHTHIYIYISSWMVHHQPINPWCFQWTAPTLDCLEPCCQALKLSCTSCCCEAKICCAKRCLCLRCSMPVETRKCRRKKLETMWINEYEYIYIYIWILNLLYPIHRPLSATITSPASGPGSPDGLQIRLEAHHHRLLHRLEALRLCGPLRLKMGDWIDQPMLMILGGCTVIYHIYVYV